MSRIAEGLESEDENLREVEREKRWLYIAGFPGSGKSEVIKEGAIRAAKKGFSVLIVCPTCQLVHSFKSQLPEVDGIENIRVDTTAERYNAVPVDCLASLVRVCVRV